MSHMWSGKIVSMSWNWWKTSSDDARNPSLPLRRRNSPKMMKIKTEVRWGISSQREGALYPTFPIRDLGQMAPRLQAPTPIRLFTQTNNSRRPRSSHNGKNREDSYSLYDWWMMTTRRICRMGTTKTYLRATTMISTAMMMMRRGIQKRNLLLRRFQEDHLMISLTVT